MCDKTLAVMSMAEAVSSEFFELMKRRNWRDLDKEEIGRLNTRYINACNKIAEDVAREAAHGTEADPTPISVEGVISENMWKEDDGKTLEGFADIGIPNHQTMSALACLLIVMHHELQGHKVRERRLELANDMGVPLWLQPAHGSMLIHWLVPDFE